MNEVSYGGINKCYEKIDERRTYRETIKAIHTDVVTRAIDNLSQNRVIGSKPLPISKKEKYIPRQTCATLSFRSLELDLASVHVLKTTNTVGWVLSWRQG